MYFFSKSVLNVFWPICLLNEVKLRLSTKMDSSRTEMCKSLIDWFKVLIKDDGKVKSDHLDNLNDGVAMARALNKLGPEFFTGISTLHNHRLDVGM